MTTPAKVKLKIYQGATFRRRLRWSSPNGTPIDLTGCTARMQVRAEVDSPQVLLAFSTLVQPGLGLIVLGGASGTIELIAEAAVTEAISWDSGVYDLEVVMADGDVQRLMEGSVVVSKEVTRG